MVRTRNNNRNPSGSPSKECSSSFKPISSGNKKSRKRQLTDTSSISALSPVPGPSTPPVQCFSQATATQVSTHVYSPRSQSDSGRSTDSTRIRHTADRGVSTVPPVSSSSVLGALGGGPPLSVLATSPRDGVDLDMEPAGGWDAGYLTPGGSHGLGVASYGRDFHQEEHQGAEQDLVESHHSDDGDCDIPPAADLVIFGTRESAVQADMEDGNGQVGDKNNTYVLPDDLKQSLECPVCARISLPPIMQCRNGHVTCNPCRLKIQSCPMCREIDIDIRNLVGEKAVTHLAIPCEYRQFGCRVEIQYKEKEAHERVCKFRPYICPYIECDHKLAADAVVEHVSTAHREECRRSDGPEITASMILIGMYFGGDGAWSPRVITCFGRTFFDVALTRDRWLHHWVWLLGEEEEADNYLYEITAFKGNVKYVFGGEVSSLRTSDDEIVSEGQCLSISDAIGRKLRDGDKIRYKLKLMRKPEVQR